MNITPAPWKLCSNELERNFQIVGADGIPIATICTQNSALVEPWRNTRTSSKKLWERIATPREQDNARIMERAPELLAYAEALLVALDAELPASHKHHAAGERHNLRVLVRQITGDFV